MGMRASRFAKSFDASSQLIQGNEKSGGNYPFPGGETLLPDQDQVGAELRPAPDLSVGE